MRTSYHSYERPDARATLILRARHSAVSWL
jgi:hypothetical protein